MSEFTTVCRVEEIPEGSARMVFVAGVQVGLFHIDGEIYAVDDRCPHAGASLARGLISGCTISCRIHHWKFSLVDGKRLDEKSDSHELRCFPVRVVDSKVQICVGESC